MTEEELVEKVAKAMFEQDTAQMGTAHDSPKWTWEKLFDDAKRYWQDKARAAIAAMKEAGWKSEAEVDDIVWNERISAQEAYER